MSDKKDIGPGWHWIEFEGFRQDVDGCTLEDGTYFPPTFNWTARIKAMRSDGTHFYVPLVLGNDLVIDGKVNIKTISTDLNYALFTLETFRTCTCLVGNPCRLHR